MVRAMSSADAPIFPTAFGRLYRVNDRIVQIDAATNLVRDILEDVGGNHWSSLGQSTLC